MRRAARVDTAQQSIVDGLRAAGYRVEIIGRPVDLLVGKAHVCVEKINYKGLWSSEIASTEGKAFYRWQLVEVKTPTKSGKRRTRADQEAQDTFIQETGTPVVMSLAEALKALEGL